MEKQLIYRNEYNILELTDEINNKALFFQELLNPVIEANLQENFTLNNNHLDQVFRNPKDFIAGILVPENTQVAGLNINRAKMFELLELPANVKEIINEIESLKLYEGVGWNANGKFLQHLEIEENTVKPTAKYLSQIEASNSTYIETEQQKAVFEAVTSMQENMKTIVENLPYNKVFDVKLLKSIFLVADNFDGTPINGNQVFTINHIFFKTF